MSEQKMDFAKVLAILAQPKETPAPLENVERRILDVPFITCDGALDRRKMKIFIPTGVRQPMPLIWIPHYEMGEDALELRDYLAQGWAVACPSESPADANSKLSTDGVIFNNAALFTLRQMPEFDPDRIALVGGSAGGYMTLMQVGTNLGICAAIANGPIANMYFNSKYYFPMAQDLNRPALMQMMAQKKEEGEKPENPALALMQSLSKLPIPFIAALGGQFVPNAERFSEDSDVALWEATSGVGIANRFSNPLMVNHNSSDVLVPVDQITRRFTYTKPGESLPDSFDMRLPHDFPGKMKYTLEEGLPAEQTQVTRIAVPEGPQPESVLPYNPDKMFNLNIFDDGAPEGYGSHSARMDVGRRYDVPYLKEMLDRTASKTNVLMPGMLKYMLELYEGKNVAYPIHGDVDETAFGSLTVYRKKVCMELAQWCDHHGREELNTIFAEAVCHESFDTVRHLEMTLQEILEKI